MGPSFPPQKGGEPPIFGPCLLWPNGCMDQDAIWYRGRPRPKPHCARWESSSPLQKTDTAPNFRPMSIVLKRLNRSRCHLVSRQTSTRVTLCYMGTQLPLPKKVQSPTEFSAHVCCGQTAAWIKMPLNIEVGLGPGHIVQHCVRWVPSFTPQGAQLPNFGACLLWPIGYVDQDATWYKGMCFGPGRILLHGDPAPLPKGAQSPNFQPMSIVVKRSPKPVPPV